MIILVGASASGKTEIAKILIDKFNYNKCITTTTRSPRVGEEDGVSYHFVSTEQFAELLKNDSFVEVACYQQQMYGTQKKDLCQKGVIILEPTGANAIVNYLQDKAFLVMIHSDKKLRKQRMVLRKDNKKLIKERLKKDDQHFKKENLLKLDLFIDNKDQSLEDLAKEIDNAYKNYQNIK